VAEILYGGIISSMQKFTINGETMFYYNKSNLKQ